jgi:hypothetical protein
VEVRFSSAVQTGPEAKPAYYTMGTGSLPGIRRQGRGVDHPPHLAPRLKKEYSYTSTSLSAVVACSRANFTFTLRTGMYTVRTAGETRYTASLSDQAPPTSLTPETKTLTRYLKTRHYHQNLDCRFWTYDIP